MKKIVVIGANHAGVAAINTILDNYKGYDVTVFDKNSNISFLGCGMALWIGKQIDGAEGLFYSNKDILESKGAKVHMNSEVHEIDYSNKIVKVMLNGETKHEEAFDKLILATGSLPIFPNIKGKELENVQQVKLYQNAAEVIEKLETKNINDVAVIGAGYIGVELAEAFKRLNKNVVLIDIANSCLANYYDDDFTKLMNQRLEDNGISLAFNQAVKELKGNVKVESVVTDKAEYKADMVVMAVGFRPNNALGKDNLELFKNGAYLVSKNQETSVNDVYAVGDCAVVYDNAINDVNYIALATNAVRSGVIAGHNVCGTSLETVGVQGSNGICIWDLKMVSTGLTLSKALSYGYDAVATDYEDLQKPAFIKGENAKVKIRIVYDKTTRVILGAQIASDYDISMAIHMFSLAVQEKITIDKLKLLDIFFLPHFNQPYNYITMAALTAK